MRDAGCMASSSDTQLSRSQDRGVNFERPCNLTKTGHRDCRAFYCWSSRSSVQKFESLVAMASVLVGATSRSQATSEYIHRCGQMIFSKCLMRLRVVTTGKKFGSLLTHIGSGSPEEIDTAINVFVTMVDDDGLDGRAKSQHLFQLFFDALLTMLNISPLLRSENILYSLHTGRARVNR